MNFELAVNEGMRPDIHCHIFALQLTEF